MPLQRCGSELPRYATVPGLLRIYFFGEYQIGDV